MDIITTQNELRLLTGRLIKWGGKYKEARKAFGDAKCELDILLTPKQDSPDYRKASYEKQLLMLRYETQENHKTEVYKYHEDYIKQEQKYKGIEKLMETITTRITTIQSLLRNERENT